MALTNPKGLMRRLISHQLNRTFSTIPPQNEGHGIKARLKNTKQHYQRRDSKGDNGH